MIKILNKKQEEPKVYRTACDECSAEFEYEESDTHIGAWGGREIVCPVCGETIFVDEPVGIDLDENNIEFPLHFVSPSDKAVDIDDAKIQEWVREYLRKAKQDSDNSGFYLTSGGNTVVIVFKFEDEYNVYVTKKYYECSIPR